MWILDKLVYFFCSQIFTGGFLASLISGLISSLIFIFFLLLVFRPKIKISNLIATQIDQFDPQQRRAYAVKVINKSKFSAFDMKIEVSQKFAFPGPNGLQNFRVTALTLVKDQYPHVARFSKKDPYSSYALRFRSYDDWDSILNDPRNLIEVKIICRHELTGLGRVFLQQYTHAQLKHGTFESGNSFGVV